MRPQWISIISVVNRREGERPRFVRFQLLIPYEEPKYEFFMRERGSPLGEETVHLDR
jgi:hypothetical protein